MRSRVMTLLLFASTLLAAAPAAPAEPESPAEAAEEARPRTLFQRIGGTPVLARLVDVFVDGLFADPVIRANAAVHRGAPPSRRPGLKFQITTLLCQETGGPCKYAGRTLRESHLSLGITEHEWTAM